ncbi:hypothetical protein [Streptomyces sp. JB150]|uniref:hypothetical protein n=1 Tax=Streptomyces sp. JB150 TaxID=2714844 RepID=UPI00140A7921|nr:hypothetical protein [Streptomyces sp. JB150]QIJ66327.1 hypothetical protein G7Z13_33215 [Streptomyces sp. JB150]
MRMVRHFTGSHFDLRDLADELTAADEGLAGSLFLDSVPARYTSGDLDEAVAVTGFHLGVAACQPYAQAPPQEAVADYVRREFADPAGGFCMPHDQDVLRIHRPRA